jgi:predicted amidohydrolase YtcJ
MAMSRTAELVLVNGRIRTPAHPSGFAQAMAIGGGFIRALGSDAQIRELTGRRTRIVNLRGRLALPAFGDAHVHPVLGGLESMRCNLLGWRTRNEYLGAIAAYSTDLPRNAWILGGGWSMPAFPGGTPAAADLDQVTGGRPAFLPSRDHHSAWVNTAALTIARIGPRTPDPADGRIERDAGGFPTGTLHDGAMRLVADYVPKPSGDELTAALLAAQRYLHSLGITSVADACVGDAGEIGVPDTFGTYRRAAADRLLTMRVVGSLWWDRHLGPRQIDRLAWLREQADGGGYFRATAVTMMLDGACETLTAAMSAPYLDGQGRDSGRSGSLFIGPGELAEATGRLSDLGFQLHFQATGDHAVTTALDAIEALPRAASQSARHHIAHLQFISPPDLKRFAPAGAVASFMPLRACNSDQNAELIAPFVGPERAAWQYRIGELSRNGGRVAFGSGWPASSPDPLQEMHAAVNRVLSARLGEPGTPETTLPLLPEEAITLDAAVHAFTAGVAYVNHEDDIAGTLAPGMLADVAVIDQDLYRIPSAEIGSASVAMTIASGQVVHGDE